MEAIIRGTPVRFKVSRKFATTCLSRVGSVVVHDSLGPLFCDEIEVSHTGDVSRVILIGTSSLHNR